MSELTTEAPATEATAAENDPTTPKTEAPATSAEKSEPPADLGDAGKKAIDAMKAERDAARREARANADAAKRWAEHEEAQKSEEQRQADRHAQIERERDEARNEGLRYKAAAKHGIGEDYFDLLGSGDEETISSRAERVGGLLQSNKALTAEVERLTAEVTALRDGKPPSAGSARPVAALRPGASAEEVPPVEVSDYPSHWFPKARGGHSNSGS